MSCRYTTYFFDFAIFAYAIVVGLGVNEAEVAFLVLFIVEIMIMIYAMGPKDYFRNAWNTLVRVCFYLGNHSTAACRVPNPTLDLPETGLTLCSCWRRIDFIIVMSATAYAIVDAAFEHSEECADG